jgi:hypothetical protein
MAPVRVPPPPRSARLVLVDRDGVVLGALPTVAVETPWWQDTEPVVRAVRERFGLEVVVLRLLDADGAQPAGGAVTYVAQTGGAPPAELEPWSGELPDHHLRMAWARPGGPAADLRWADDVLASLGIARVEPARQARTWNLSSLWRLPTDTGDVWLKHVPSFFAHEGALLAELQGRPVPTLLGHEHGRILMRGIPGDDQYDAQEELLRAMIALLVDVQRAWVGSTDELLKLHLPDWRPPALTVGIADVVDRTAAELPKDQRDRLGAFVAALDDRFAEIATCGVPDTLVHGDFHAGNVRGVPGHLVLLDWGDSGVGNPLLDQPAFFAPLDDAQIPPLRELWSREWTSSAPGSDPQRAGDLLRPVAAARQAVIYRRFLDNIEPSERRYHQRDPALWLGFTAEILAGSG